MHFNQIEANGYVLVEDRPTWILDSINHGRTYYKHLLPLLDFFVFESPVEGLSSRRKTIQDYGWNNPWGRPTYLNKQLKDASNNRFLYYSASNLNLMEEALNRAGLLADDNSLELEIACFYNNKKNQTLSCFYHLRNSICHGRFAIIPDKNEQLWIACEDRSGEGVKNRSGKKLSARMLLKISTLEDWKTLITGGPAIHEE